MPIFQLLPSRELRPLPETTFEAERILERNDIQRYLRERISVIDERLLVVAEEFGDWLDSSRRIDLLCIDSKANLVVLEIKRTEDGGHMELQALRYAAMVSAMTFQQLVETFARHRNRAKPDPDEAKAEILRFLDWAEVEEDQFAQDTHIVLVAANFSKELTTAVMWLRQREVNIRCVRLKPYRMADGSLILDVQQIIPLPEAAEFQTQLGIKKQAELRSRSDRQQVLLKFWQDLLECARTKKLETHAGRTPSDDPWLSGNIGRTGFTPNYTARRNDCQVDLWISFGAGQSVRNKAAFKSLEKLKDEVEADFGAKLDWLELPGADGCRVRFLIEGGYRSPPEQWPTIHDALVDAMGSLDKAFRSRIRDLVF